MPAPYWNICTSHCPVFVCLADMTPKPKAQPVCAVAIQTSSVRELCSDICRHSHAKSNENRVKKMTLCHQSFLIFAVGTLEDDDKSILRANSCHTQILAPDRRTRNGGLDGWVVYPLRCARRGPGPGERRFIKRHSGSRPCCTSTPRSEKGSVLLPVVFRRASGGESCPAKATVTASIFMLLNTSSRGGYVGVITNW